MFNRFNLPIERLIGNLDLFHAWDWYLPRTNNAQLITTVHDLALFKFPDTAHPQIKQHHQATIDRIKQFNAQIITVSESTKTDLISMFGFSENKIQVIYEALPEENHIKVTPKDVEQVKSQFKLHRPYFLIVGTQEPRKNIPRMVQAWQAYQDDYQLVIVGKAAWDKITPQPGIVVTGFIEGKKLASLYQGASCFLYASLYEGFGLPMLEAFYHRVPVVTSNVSSMPEVAGDAAVLVDPYDTTSIIKGIHQAMAQKTSLIREGRFRLGRFSWQKAAQETYQLYHQIAS